jgi:hypothetical protein
MAVLGCAATARNGRFVVIVDEGAVILQRQRDAGVAGVASALDQRLAAPDPDFLAREWLVDNRPEALGNVVGG